jgi:hypothetical protein
MTKLAHQSPSDGRSARQGSRREADTIEVPLRSAFRTFGCKLNQLETEALAARFETPAP